MVKHQIQIDYPVTDSNNLLMVLNEEGQVIGDLQNLCLNTFPTFLHPFQDVFEETLGN